MSPSDVRKLAILGASGHGKVVADIAELNGFNEIYFFDDRWPALKQVEHWPIIGNTQSLLESCKAFTCVIVAIGNNVVRLEKQRLLQQAGALFKPFCHPSASVSRYSQVGGGTVVMAHAVVNPFSKVGDACIINTSAVVDHDCHISDGAHISPGALLAGGVHVGVGSWVGIGAQVIQLVKIGSDCMVGAGATVVNDIADGLTVVGTPAKPKVKG